MVENIAEVVRDIEFLQAAFGIRDEATGYHWVFHRRRTISEGREDYLSTQGGMATWNIKKATRMEMQDLRELKADAKVNLETQCLLAEKLDWTGLDLKQIKMLVWGSLRHCIPQG